MDSASSSRESRAKGGSPGLRRYLVPAVVVVATLLVLAFVVPQFTSSSPFNYWHEDIDITCGRKRTRHYILGLRISSRIEDTEGSKLYRETVGEPGTPEWRTVNTFSPGSDSSPNHAYHRSLDMLSELTETLRKDDFSQELTAYHLADFFSCLQKGNNDAEAQMFMQIFRKSH